MDEMELMSEYRDDEFHLYFIVRSMIMGLLGAGTFSIIISFLHTSKLLYVLSISVASFFTVLFITRTFDGQIRELVEMILGRLNQWPRAKDFLLRNF
jgi:hypothetical protein